MNNIREGMNNVRNCMNNVRQGMTDGMNNAKNDTSNVKQGMNNMRNGMNKKPLLIIIVEDKAMCKQKLMNILQMWWVRSTEQTILL